MQNILLKSLDFLFQFNFADVSYSTENPEKQRENAQSFPRANGKLLYTENKINIGITRNEHLIFMKFAELNIHAQYHVHL